eukprot:1180561-Prorocentrum_minimum.AAC.7
MLTASRQVSSSSFNLSISLIARITPLTLRTSHPAIVDSTSVERRGDCRLRISGEAITVHIKGRMCVSRGAHVLAVWRPLPTAVP